MKVILIILLLSLSNTVAWGACGDGGSGSSTASSSPSASQASVSPPMERPPSWPSVSPPMERPPLEKEGKQKLLIRWTDSPDNDVAGYIVYLGIQSGSYMWQFDVGMKNSVFVEGVERGRTYYCIVRAYDRLWQIGPPTYEAAIFVPIKPIWQWDGEE